MYLAVWASNMYSPMFISTPDSFAFLFVFILTIGNLSESKIVSPTRDIGDWRSALLSFEVIHPGRVIQEGDVSRVEMEVAPGTSFVVVVKSETVLVGLVAVL